MMSMSQRLVQRHGLDLRFGDTCLPLVTEELESGEHDEVLELLKDAVVTDVNWRSQADWFLCLVIPSMIEPCVAFYKDKGPRLDKLVTLDFVRKIDKYLVSVLKALSCGADLAEMKEIEP